MRGGAVVSGGALAIAPAGYVRACFSKRARGYALPLDLVRRHLGAVNRGGVARRLRREFSGYLVTDEAPEIWRDVSGRVHVVCAELMTGRTEHFSGVFRAGFYAGSIDAPDFLAAGECGKYLTTAGEVCAVQRMAVRRGLWS